MSDNRVDLELGFSDGSMETAISNVVKSMKELETETAKTGKKMVDTFDAGAKSVDKGKKIIDDTTAAIAATGKELDAASKTTATYTSTLAKTNAELAKVKDSYKAAQAESKRLSGEIKEQQQITQDFRTELARLEEKYKALPKASIPALQATEKKINQLKAAIKDNNLAMSQMRIDKATADANVKAIGAQEKELIKYKKSITDANRGLLDMIPGVGGFIRNLEAKKNSLQGVLAGFRAAAGGAQALRVALFSTGIGAIVVALGSLIAFLTKTQRGMDLMSRASSALGIIFQKITDLFSSAGEVIFDTLSKPKVALKALMDFLVGQITNRLNGFLNLFKAIGSGIQAIADRDMGALRKAAEDAALSVGAINTGFSEEQISNGIKKVVNGMQEIGKAVSENDKLELRSQELNRRRIGFIEKEAKLNADMQKARETISDADASILEKRKALAALEQAEKDLTNEKLFQKKEELNILQGKNLLTKDTNKDIEAEANLKKEVLEIEEASARAGRINNRERKTVNKEAAAAAKQRQKEEQEAAKVIKKLNEDLAKSFQDLDDERRKRGIDLLEGEAKLNAEKELALELGKRQIEAIKLQIDEAEKAGVSQEEISKRRAALIDIEKSLRLLTEEEFNKKALELDKERREKELKAFIQSAERKLEIERIRLQNAGRSQGLNNDSIRIQILEAERKAIEEAYQKELETVRDNQEEIIRVTEEFEIKLGKTEADLRKARFDAKFNELDLSLQLQEQEIELLRVSGDNRFSLEEYKEKRLLEIRLEGAKKRLELIRAESGPNSPEAKLLEGQIKRLEQGIKDIGNGLAGPLQVLRNSIIAALGIPEGEFDKIASSLGNVFNQYKAYIDQMVAESEDKLKSIQDRKKEVEGELKEEEERNKKGLASNVSAKKLELAQIAQEEKKAQKEAEKRKKEALRLQLLTEAAQQASSLSTAIGNIIAGFSTIPFVGVALGLAAAAGLVIQVLSMRARIKAASSQKLYKGDLLSRVLGDEEGSSDSRPRRRSGFIAKFGRTDRNGGRGYKILGTNVEVGGDEYLLNGKSTAANLEFVDKMNSGRYDKLNLKHIAEEALSGSRKIVATAAGLHKQTIIVQQAQQSDLTHRGMEQMFNKHSSKLIHYFENEKEEIIPLEDGKFLRKTGKNLKITEGL